MTPTSENNSQAQPILIALDHLTPATTLGHSPQEAHPAQVQVGEMITVVVVMAANVVRDIRENIRNLVGGRMGHYEKLIQGAVDAALADLQTKARNKGYDGVVGVKICHPNVVEGGVEVIVYGNGFWLHSQKSGAESAQGDISVQGNQNV